MDVHELDGIEEREPMPGFRGRFIHSAAMTFAYWSIDDGATLPEHSHPQEQVAHGLEGEFELTVDGETTVLRPGDILVIPSNVVHSGRAITACRILDVFHPVREDYRAATAD